MPAADKNDFMAPALVLPDQFFAEFAKRPGIDSERRLMLAVLEDAVHCYQRYALSRDPRGRFEFDEARKWVESSDREWPFSFENICDVLELEAAYIREGLRRHAPDARREDVLERVSPRIMPLDAHARVAELDEIAALDAEQVARSERVNEAAA